MADDQADNNVPSSSETGYTPGDDAGTRWRNWFSLLTGRMNVEGKRQYRIDANRRHSETHCKQCEKNRDHLLKYSPIIRYMSDEIGRLGGHIGRENIYCMPCDEDSRHSGGFNPRFGIKLCANEMRNRGHVEDTLAHEMIHAWDHQRFRVDWTGNLRHAACSEIRASSLSGECRWWREFATRGQLRLTQQHQECVRRRAALSLAVRPGVRDDMHAARIVNEVWESCFADIRPFEEIYR